MTGRIVRRGQFSHRCDLPNPAKHGRGAVWRCLCGDRWTSYEGRPRRDDSPRVQIWRVNGRWWHWRRRRWPWS